MVTAGVKDGKLTGQFQNGDWSHHEDFDSLKSVVMTRHAFDAELQRRNDGIHERNMQSERTFRDQTRVRNSYSDITQILSGDRNGGDYDED